MSFSGLFAVGVSGVTAFTSSLEAVSNNIANSQTVGFKRSRTEFSDLVSIDAPDAGGKVGAGVSALNRQLVGEQGSVTRTDSATDMAIAGAGFFVVSESADAAGGSTPLFTRAGDFSPNAAGDLVNGAGLFLQGARAGAGAPPTGALSSLETVNIYGDPPLAAGATPVGALIGVEIDEDGQIVAAYATGEEIVIYRLPLALFANPEGLDETRGTAFLSTTASGAPVLVAPKQGRAGAIESAAVEISTVDIGQEFSTLIETQRAYASNARIISVADELWRTLVETAA